MPGGYTAAAANFMVFDKEGLVGRGRRGLTEEVMVYARADLPDGMDIASAIEQEIGARCGEIWGRCGRDVGEMWGRCRGDRAGEAAAHALPICPYPYPYPATPKPPLLPLSPRCYP